MKFSEYQKLAQRTEKPLDLKDALMHGMIGAFTEAGELGDAVKKHVFYNKELDFQNVREEIGDLMWYLAVIANNLGMDMDEIAAENIDKLKIRYPEKYSNEAAVIRADKTCG